MFSEKLVESIRKMYQNDALSLHFTDKAYCLYFSHSPQIYSKPRNIPFPKTEFCKK